MLTLVWQVDPNALLETDWLLHVVGLTGLPFEQQVDGQHAWVGPGAIVVTTGEARNGIGVSAYLERFRAAGHPVGVIHVGDEFSARPIDFYDAAAFVYRQCERPEVMARPNVAFLPLGFKRGLQQHLVDAPMADRRYLWSFAGFIPGRLSRRSMAHVAATIPGGTLHAGRSFNDSSDLSFETYVRVLCDTRFCLAPGGNRHVESYRVYEAMMAGAVPVVEVLTPGKLLLKSLKDVLSPARARTYGTWSRRYWRELAYWWRHRDLWAEQFGPDFPCPRVRHWRELPALLASIDPVERSAEVRRFWAAYQDRLGATLARRVREQLGVTVLTPAPTGDERVDLPTAAPAREPALAAAFVFGDAAVAAGLVAADSAVPMHATPALPDDGQPRRAA